VRRGEGAQGTDDQHQADQQGNENDGKAGGMLLVHLGRQGKDIHKYIMIKSDKVDAILRLMLYNFG
jgi:hypothetical protein